MCNDDIENLVPRRNSFFDFVRKTYFLGNRHWQMTEMYINNVIRGQLVRKWRRESEDEWTNIHDDDDDDDYDDDDDDYDYDYDDNNNNNNNNNDCTDPDVRDGHDRSRKVADYTITRKWK